MESEPTTEVTIDVDSDLEKEWYEIEPMETKYVMLGVSKEPIFGSSVIEGDFIRTSRKANAFADAARIAYQFHIPLQLSPDVVWLAIAQGFANHVNENSERLRKKFVDFDGKKQLTVIRDTTDLFTYDWSGIISEFSSLIKENIGVECHTMMAPTFSTTTIVEQVACEITLMDAMKNYFKYDLCGGCGISKVKFIGTLEDWIKVKQMTEKQRSFDCEWWIDFLVPVLDKFISAYQEEEIDQTFWNDIYVYREGGYGAPSTATGWITNFFPYIGDDKDKYINTNMFDITHKGMKEQLNVDTGAILSGRSVVPFEFTSLLTGEKTNCKFVSGFFGVEKKNGFISPHIGWAVTQEKKPKK